MFGKDLLPTRGNVGLSTATIVERDDSYEATLELPGFSREEISIGINERKSKIRVDATREVDEEGVYKNREVSKSVRVPEDVDTEVIEASYNNGVLNIEMPKREESREDYREIELE
jgi:HSP20 family protein